jgi:mono/diheme cytochrome c family protein
MYMNKRLRGVSSLAIIAVFVLGLLATVGRGPTGGPDANCGDVAQGAYIVNELAHCAACHNTKLEGRPAIPGNAAFVPRPKIAGLPMFANNADAVTFLMTTTLPAGMKPISPQMPPYHMKASDALAVVAYLRTLQ